MTRLADFILANREPILAEWETFARSCAPAGRPMDIAALRDHANEMLQQGDRPVARAIVGVAIPPEQLDGIFNPMKPRRAPRAARARGPTGSLGLGLHIAERIVSAHGGRIQVTSSDARGTTYTIQLPRRETAPSA